MTVRQPREDLHSHPPSQWSVRPPAPPDVAANLARELGIPPVLASVVWARGLGEDPLGRLEPPLTPTALPAIEAAAERLEAAIRGAKRILIHGDYDADGITGTALLTLGLRALGATVAPFIPNRLGDGYGIHPDRVPEHIERADLFLTVDCGIANLEEIRTLQAAGIEVIVTDHHSPGPELPACLIVHPQVATEAGAGQPELTGAGLAFHLLWGLHRRLGLETPLEYSDIASIGTIADVAPLMGENRALIREGLARLADSRWPGLRACLQQAGLRTGPTARDVAFVIAPRLNAAGRLGEAELGLELFTTASERRARELAAYLEARNHDRRRIQNAMFEQALERIDPDDPAIVLDDPDWHPGVMGIVASKLLERVYRPVFITAAGKGSVRSTPGISAVDCLREARLLLKRFGGHAQAAGFAIEQENLAAFRSAVHRFVAAHPKPLPTVTGDALLAPGEVSQELYRSLCSLEPFGEGHPPPLFVLTDGLDQARAVGREGATLQLQLGGLRGVAWQKGHLAPQLREAGRVNAAVVLRENDWNGKRQLEFIAQNVRRAKPLGFPETSVGLSSPDAVRRGSPPADLQSRLAAIHDSQDLAAAPPGTGLWFRRLPLHGPPAAPATRLGELLARKVPLYFDLEDGALAELEARAGDYPDVADLRRGFVQLQRRLPLPYSEPKTALILEALAELDLLDARGQPRRGERRDPYRSETLLRGLVEQYRLLTFVKAYRALAEAAFAETVRILFAAGGNPNGNDGTGSEI